MVSLIQVPVGRLGRRNKCAWRASVFACRRAFLLSSRQYGASHGAGMKRSADRILTTHVGSLIRPPALQDFLRAKQGGKPFDQAAYDACLKDSVAEIVRQQAEVGIDVVSDGEFGKSISWS